MSYNSKERFDKFLRESYFTRIDDTHPLELMIGLNEGGNPSLRYFGEFSPRNVSGTSAVDVRQLIVDGIKCLEFSLKKRSCQEIFFKLCDDLVDSSRSVGERCDGYTFLVDRFLQWKKLFVSDKKTLSLQETMGLIGELSFMKLFLMPKYGTHQALLAWTAPECGIKDFSIGDAWYEIKAVGAEATSVTINSLQQLESENVGWLVLFYMERMAPSFSGVTLDGLVGELLSSFSGSDDATLFVEKLGKRGYSADNDGEEIVFSIKKVEKYKVDSSFPIIREKNIPEAVQKISYSLLIKELVRYLDDN